MKDDEALYAQAGIELVNNPNQGLLVKSTTQFPNDPNQAKAEYIRVRVEQMKEDLALELERKKREKKERESKKRDIELQVEARRKKQSEKQFFIQCFTQQKLAECQKIVSIYDGKVFTNWLSNKYGVPIYVAWIFVSMCIPGAYADYSAVGWWDRYDLVFLLCIGWSGLVVAVSFFLGNYFANREVKYWNAREYLTKAGRFGLDKSTEDPK